MPPQSSAPTSRELLHAKLDALLDECDLAADNAGYGQTFDVMENFFLHKGREFVRETFEQKLQERIKRTENDAEAKQCPDCKKKRNTKIRKRKP